MASLIYRRLEHVIGSGNQLTSISPVLAEENEEENREKNNKKEGNKKKGISLILMFLESPLALELPEELCQLADIQKLRREKAIEDYKMNEDGLLIKPWHLIERNNPQKDGNYRDDGYCFPTKNSRVSNHILQQSRMYFVKADLENQIHMVKSVEGP